MTDYGVFLPFDSLAMHIGYGDYLSEYTAEDAMEGALWTIKQEYPSISYEGYAIDTMSDVHGGETCRGMTLDLYGLDVITYCLDARHYSFECLFAAVLGRFVLLFAAAAAGEGQGKAYNE